jgi:hypothetical protein
MANRAISLRCRNWSLSGHSGHRVSGTTSSALCAVRHARPRSCIIDGEAVVCDSKGMCEPPSPRRLHALMPWRAARLADLRADEELRRRVALAEERLADLKAALEDMRAQRDAWQAMAQARIRPAPVSSTVAVAVATRNGVMSKRSGASPPLGRFLRRKVRYWRSGRRRRWRARSPAPRALDDTRRYRPIRQDGATHPPADPAETLLRLEARCALPPS